MKLSRLLCRILLAALVVGGAIAMWPLQQATFTADEVKSLVDKLNYNAAVYTPHLLLGEETRSQHTMLFEAVERGAPLDAVQSAEYRVLYQAILRDNQWYLSLFDRNLAVVADHAMGEHNNVGSRGIPGQHNHHDFSAHSNYRSMKDALRELEHSEGAFSALTRVVNATSAYKDLTDIILHMATAPQTKSTPYHPHPLADDLDRLFEDVMVNYKAAQFEPVNSPAYVAALHRALASYDALVLLVQGRVNAHLSPWESTVAGPWLSWRSFGPDLEGKLSGPFARIERNKFPD